MLVIRYLGLQTVSRALLETSVAKHLNKKRDDKHGRRTLSFAVESGLLCIETAHVLCGEQLELATYRRNQHSPK